MTDIEKALAEALAYAIEHHEHHDSVAIVACGRGRLDYCIPAILATPQMRAIARQAAIGAAVERLPDRFTLWWYLVDDGEPWWVCEDADGTAFDAETPAAAIAAALGEDDD